MSLLFQGPLRREKRPLPSRVTNGTRKLGKMVAEKTVSPSGGPDVALSKSAAEKTISPTAATKLRQQIVALSKSAAEKTISPTAATRLSRRIVALGKADPKEQSFFWRGGYLAEELRNLRQAKLAEPDKPAEAKLAIRYDKQFAERFTRALLTDLCHIDLTTESSALRYLVREGNKQRQAGITDSFVCLDTDIPGASLKFRSPGISAGMGDITAMPLDVTVRIK